MAYCPWISIPFQSRFLRIYYVVVCPRTLAGCSIRTLVLSGWCRISYAPDTHQDQAIGRLHTAEFARPWLFRAPENLRFPAVSKSFGSARCCGASLDILLAVGTQAHASPKQARNRGVSITAVPWHGSMWWMNRRPIIPGDYKVQSEILARRFIQKLWAYFPPKALSSSKGTPSRRM